MPDLTASNPMTAMRRKIEENAERMVAELMPAPLPDDAQHNLARTLMTAALVATNRADGMSRHAAVELLGWNERDWRQVASSSFDAIARAGCMMFLSDEETRKGALTLALRFLSTPEASR